ncbi:hypothetical protein OPV22_017128 [Ensete ventricosum]|uniref:Uncharacterized protein n=1 Tax=Ensete ventricosum TaxID=4639 RepID=A0AAV8QVL9_ENSVE|nr:hypothetical protein OPV22_017128 [Ensete ventricosum]
MQENSDEIFFEVFGGSLVAVTNVSSFTHKCTCCVRENARDKWTVFLQVKILTNMFVLVRLMNLDPDLTELIRYGLKDERQLWLHRISDLKAWIIHGYIEFLANWELLLCYDYMTAVEFYTVWSLVGRSQFDTYAKRVGQRWSIVFV